MISINNLTLSFGGFDLLKDINFHISDNDRIGLVGKNGAGKSTLLKLILGINTPTHGSVMVPPGVNIGYLPQIMEHAKGKTVLDETLTAFDSLFKMHERLEEIGRELGEKTDYESRSYHNLMVEMNEINDRITIMEDEPVESKAVKVLKGLGFKENELGRQTSTFSQGWNMRIELAKILLKAPDVLLLDEPTNHLDIESIEWFEGYLKDFKGAVVVISHDRKFLDNVTTRTVEIMLGKIYDYKVPYTKYKELRKERMEQQRAAYENQQRLIEKTEDFIERFRYKATKSNQVQSRIKQLEKLDIIEVDLEDKAALNIKFPPAPRSGNVVFECKDATIGYGTKVILNDVNMTIERGEKVAFVGRNGEGKSTLMKIITGELFPIDGIAKLGYNVDMGYFAQNQEDVLDKQDTVFGTLDKIAVGDIRTKLRDILGAFLFKGEDIDKKVAVLSGGERARLAMAKLMLRPHNLLALDEPTNHMDLLSKDLLKQALQAYDGTIIIVSHDRDFLDGLVSKVYEFKDGRVKEHLGGINDFLARKRLENLHEIERKDIKVTAKEQRDTVSTAVGGNAANNTAMLPDKSSNNKAAKREHPILTAQQQRELDKEIRTVRNKVKKAEEEIEALEGKKKAIEDELAGGGTPQKMEELYTLYEEVGKKLEEAMEIWTIEQERLDKLVS